MDYNNKIKTFIKLSIYDKSDFKKMYDERVKTIIKPNYENKINIIKYLYKKFGITTTSKNVMLNTIKWLEDKEINEKLIIELEERKAIREACQKVMKYITDKPKLRVIVEYETIKNGYNIKSHVIQTILKDIYDEVFEEIHGAKPFKKITLKEVLTSKEYLNENELNENDLNENELNENELNENDLNEDLKEDLKEDLNENDLKEDLNKNDLNKNDLKEDLKEDLNKNDLKESKEDIKPKRKTRRNEAPKKKIKTQSPKKKAKKIEVKEDLKEIDLKEFL